MQFENKDFQKAMLDELMSQYVDVDNKDFWDDSVSIQLKDEN